MQTERARELGLCFGVRRALDMVLSASHQYRALQTLGPIAHNRVLLAELESQGVRSVTSIDDLTGPTVVVSAHGVAPATLATLQRKGLTIVDTTCPNVAHAQRLAAHMAREGLTIVIFGDSRHSEVRGLLGWADEGAVATVDVSELRANCPSSRLARVGIIAQTTQRARDFALFVQQVYASIVDESREMRVLNTLCDATRRRQAAAAELAGTVDVMLVIGGHTSANTQRLAETCAAIVETHLIETAEEIDENWLRGKTKVGLTAGASTPDSSIEDVEERLAGL